MKAAPSLVNRSLVLTVSSLQGGAKATYAEAGLSAITPAGCSTLFGVSMCWGERIRGDVSPVYGNWACVTDNSGDVISFCLNPFNDGPDTARFLLSAPFEGLGLGTIAPGGLTISAQTSGIASASLPIANLVCDKGLMYGFTSAANSPLYVVAIERRELGVPR